MHSCASQIARHHTFFYCCYNLSIVRPCIHELLPFWRTVYWWCSGLIQQMLVLIECCWFISPDTSIYGDQKAGQFSRKARNRTCSTGLTRENALHPQSVIAARSLRHPLSVYVYLSRCGMHHRDEDSSLGCPS